MWLLSGKKVIKRQPPEETKVATKNHPNQQNTAIWHNQTINQSLPWELANPIRFNRAWKAIKTNTRWHFDTINQSITCSKVFQSINPKTNKQIRIDIKQRTKPHQSGLLRVPNISEKISISRRFLLKKLSKEQLRRARRCAESRRHCPRSRHQSMDQKLGKRPDLWRRKWEGWQGTNEEVAIDPKEREHWD